jgi:hypothetical protein
MSEVAEMVQCVQLLRVGTSANLQLLVGTMLNCAAYFFSVYAVGTFAAMDRDSSEYGDMLRARRSGVRIPVGSEIFCLRKVLCVRY